MPDETGGNPQTNPEGSGAPASGAGSEVKAATGLSADVSTLLGNLGLEAVPRSELAEYRRVHGSVTNPNGNVHKKLADYDAWQEEKTKREEAELTEVERLKRENEALSSKVGDLETEVSDFALRFGFVSENAKRAADPEAVAVNPRIVEAQLPTILAEFEGGDVEKFVQSGLEQMLAFQKELARELPGGKPQNGPGGGPVDASGAQTMRSTREGGSVMKKMMDWKDRVHYVNDPRKLPHRG